MGMGDNLAMWWSSVAAAQLGGALVVYKGGYGSPMAMPLRAFFVSSLLLGAATCTAGAALATAGIRQVDDVRQVGQRVRQALGVTPRSQLKSKDP